MTVNTNAVIVTVTAIAYPAAPQVVFGSPRFITAANDDLVASVWLSFDGVNDAVVDKALEDLLRGAEAIALQEVLQARLAPALRKVGDAVQRTLDALLDIFGDTLPDVAAAKGHLGGPVDDYEIQA